MPKRRKYGSNEQHHFISGSYVALGLGFVCFEILSSIFILPLLIGFFFCYMFLLMRESDTTLYDFCAEGIRTNFKIGKLLPVFFTICAYALLYIFNNVLSYMDSAKFNFLGIEYFADMLVESAFCYLAFKDKLR